MIQGRYQWKNNLTINFAPHCHYSTINNYLHKTHPTPTLSSSDKMSAQLICKKPRKLQFALSSACLLRDKITGKEIFNTVWSEGWEDNPLHDLTSEEYEARKVGPNQKPVFVTCSKCQKHIESALVTLYTNCVDHVNCCFGNNVICKMVIDQLRKESSQLLLMAASHPCTSRGH